MTASPPTCSTTTNRPAWERFCVRYLLSNLSITLHIKRIHFDNGPRFDFTPLRGSQARATAVTPPNTSLEPARFALLQLEHLLTRVNSHTASHVR
jgi:hypothetical protein